MKACLDIMLRSVLLKIACPVFLGISLGYAGFSQDGTSQFRESLYLQTDRDLYVTGEEVWMKVYKLDAHGRQPDNFSKVVYIELLNQAGYPVNQIKLHLPEKSGSARFKLSDTLSSGNYLLRAYSSWMKNYAATDFFFRTISVINPYRSMANIGVKSSPPEGKAMDSHGRAKADNSIKLEISLDKQEYGPRERIGASIQARDVLGNPLEADLSVSIVKSCLLEDNRSTIQEMFPYSGEPPPGEEQGIPAPFLPELEGVVLSGTLLSSTTDEPLGNLNMILSMVGKAARCQVYRTNDRGEFFFNLDKSGMQEIVIQPVDSTVGANYIVLNPDFHNDYDHPMPGPFCLDTTRLQAVNQSIINMQVAHIYESYRIPGPAHMPDENEIDFYGEPEYRIRISDYILLKNVREVIKEIVPAVSIRIRNGKSAFWMENGVDHLHFGNQPLVLVDGVPYDDADQILNISIGELERIDVINLRYLLDGHMFEGIIHFVTNRGKMGGLEFNHTVFRQAFAGFSEGSRFSSPEYPNDSLKNSRLPDFRNTLYWNPGLQTKQDGHAGFEFYTSDDRGEYTLYLEGITGDGKSGFLVKKIRVR